MNMSWKSKKGGAKCFKNSTEEFTKLNLVKEQVQKKSGNTTVIGMHAALCHVYRTGLAWRLFTKVATYGIMVGQVNL